MASPAIIMNLEFDNSWNVGGWIFYNDKEEKNIQSEWQKNCDELSKELFDVETKYRDVFKYKYDYFDYMKNDEKSIGIFNDKTDKCTDVDIQELRNIEYHALENKMVRYRAVASFDNNFLKENGIMNKYGFINDEGYKKIRNAATKAVNALVNNTQKLDNDNISWHASIHTNTDNIHIHFQIIEKEKREKKGAIYRNGSVLELSAINKFKSTLAFSLANKSIMQEITEFERKTLTPSVNKLFSTSTNRLSELVKMLPENKNLWQYNRKQIVPIQKEINNCIMELITANEETYKEYTQYEEIIKKTKDKMVEYFGRDKMSIFVNTAQDWKQRFFTSAGNDLLNFLKEQATFCEDSKKENFYSDILSTKDNSDDYVFFDDDITKIENEDGITIKIEDDTVDDDFYDKYYNYRDTYSNKDYILDFKFVKKIKKLNSLDKLKIISKEANNNNIVGIIKLAEMIKKGIKNSTPANEELSNTVYQSAYAGLKNQIEKYEENRSSLCEDEKKEFGRSYCYYQLGKMAINGLGMKKNDLLALKYFRRAKNQFANYQLAKMYYFGTENIPVDYDVAKFYLDDAKGNNPYVYSKLATIYDKGLGNTVEDKKTAYDYYHKAFNLFLKAYKENNGNEAEELFDEQIANNPFLEYNLAKHYYYGLGTDKNIEKAEKLLLKSEETKKIPSAIFMLADIYWDKLQPEKSIEILTDLAENKNDSLSQYKLGKIYTKTNEAYGDTFVDVSKGVKYLTKSAEQNNKFACFELGKFNEQQNNLFQAINWYVKSDVNNDNSLAEYKLAKIFSSENNVKNLDKAEAFYKKSISNGNDLAKYQLAKLYLTQEKYNLPKAMELLVDSVNQTHNQFSAYTLGSIFLKNNQKRKAEFYFDISAEQNNSNALYQLGKLKIENNNDTDGIKLLKRSALEHNNEYAQSYLGCYYIKNNDTTLGKKYLLMSAEQDNDYARFVLHKVFAQNKPIKYRPKQTSLFRSPKPIYSSFKSLYKKMLNKNKRLAAEAEELFDEQIANNPLYNGEGR